MEWGPGGKNWRYDTQGFDSTKTHDDTGLHKPPREKNFQKKFFEVQLFFQEKNFCGFGVFCHHGFFELKPNPCHRRFLDRIPNRSCHRGSPPNPPCHISRTPPPPTVGTPVDCPVDAAECHGRPTLAPLAVRLRHRGFGGNPTMTGGFGPGPETHDDTGLVLNKKPMMTETPQTRKNFFLEKKVGPRKIFFGIFFLGGFGNPCHHGFRLIQTLTCHASSSSPRPPFYLLWIPLRSPRGVMEPPCPPVCPDCSSHPRVA